MVFDAIHKENLQMTPTRRMIYGRADVMEKSLVLGRYAGRAPSRHKFLLVLVGSGARATDYVPRTSAAGT